jgi:hypothetical protein
MQYLCHHPGWLPCDLTKFIRLRNRCCGPFRVSDPMNQDLSSLSIEELQKMYADADARLVESLLLGANWEDLRRERLEVTCIAKEIHSRKYPLGNTPADTPFRLDY